MTATNANIVFDSGQIVPIEFATPFELQMFPGPDPFMFSIHMGDVSAFPEPADGGKGTRCSFIFDTPRATGSGESKFIWQGMYLVRIEPSRMQEGLFLVTFGDERWRLQYKRFTLQYNQTWPDGSYRTESIRDTGQPWRTLPALRDAFKKMGYEPRFNGIVGGGLGRTSSIKLPDNLGNSYGGGYVAAQWQEVVNPMLEILDAHVYWVDGQPWVWGRTKDRLADIQKLQSTPRLVDTVGSSNNGWEKPKKLILNLEMKIEAPIQRRRNVTGTGTPILDEPHNVMPTLGRLDKADQEWWKVEQSEQAGIDWVRIGNEMARLGYLPLALSGPDADDDAKADSADQKIAEKWFKPMVVPFNRTGEFNEVKEDPDLTENALKALRKVQFNALVRKSWHRVYRLNWARFTNGNDFSPDDRPLTEMRLGRLTPEGGSTAQGSVFCDWHALMVTAYNFDKGDDPFKAEFSYNSSADLEKAAPFVARWMDPNGKDPIFILEASGDMSLAVDSIQPGLMVTNATYGNWLKMRNGEDMVEQEMQAELQSDFSFRVMSNGRVVMPIDDALSDVDGQVGEVQGRILRIERQLFPDGGIDTITRREGHVTANFAYSKSQLEAWDANGKFPDVLLNRVKIEKLADDMAAKVREEFDLGHAGGLQFPGVEAMEQKVYPGGDIYSMSIKVGAVDPWSITTEYIVTPGMPGPLLPIDELDGKPASIVVQ